MAAPTRNQDTAKRDREKYRKVKPTASSAAGVGPFMVTELPEGANMGFTSYPEYEGYNRETGEHVFTPGSYGAPLDSSDVALALRLHENGHLITSRKKLLPRYLNNIVKRASEERIDNSWLQTIFDVYVNRFMTAKGVEEIADLPLPELDEEAPIWTFAQAWLRAYDLKNWRGEHLELYDNLSDLEKTLLTDVQERVVQNANTTEITSATPLPEDLILNLASQLQDIFGSPEDQTDSGDYESVDDRRQNNHTVNEETEALQEQFQKASDGDGEWGDCSVVQMSLSKRVRTALRALRPRPGYVGAFRFPNRAHALTSDGRAFGTKRKVQGGTILFDVSGSMSLSEKQIQELIDAAPAATIACYSEKARQSGGKRKGHVVVVAKRGMYSAPRQWKSMFGARNLVDGPALAWLMRQEGPRIWVSDGEINGATRITKSMVTDTLKMMRRGNIKRIGTPEDAVDWVRGRSGIKVSDGVSEGFQSLAQS